MCCIFKWNSAASSMISHPATSLILVHHGAAIFLQSPATSLRIMASLKEDCPDRGLLKIVDISCP